MALSNNKFISQSGSLLIEIILAVALFAIIVPSLISGIITSRQGEPQQRQRQLATALIHETQDSLRTIRENRWDLLSPTGIFHPVKSDNTWVLSSGSDTVNDFTRYINISDVYRDINGNIGTSGSLDPSTKRVTTVINWQQPAVSALSAVSYFSRYLDNLTWIQTKYSDFSIGTTLAGVAVEYTNDSPTDGEIVLAGGGHGDWCLPDLTLASVDLPKNGVANAIYAIPAVGTSTPGYVFAGTGDNASGTSFAKVNVIDSDPPSASISSPGTFDGFKTNAIFGEQDYVYIGTDNNVKEIEIINLKTNPFSEAGYFDAPGNGSGNAVYVVGNVGYMASGDKFYTFDLTTKTGSRGSPLNSSHVITLAGPATKIKVINSRAYISLNSASTPLQILNVADPSFPVVIGQAVNLNDRGATDLFVNNSETRAYLVTSASTSFNELFVIDISTHTGNQPVLASFDTKGMSPKGVIAVTNNKVITVGIGGTEYQVFTYNDVNKTITACGPGLHIPTGINGIATVIQPSGGAFSYIITGDAASELKIIEGGPNGQSTSGGYYISPIKDATISTAFNRLSFNAIIPFGAGINFQVAIADPVSGGCAGANYVFKNLNPDGSIPLDDDGLGYENPGQCLKYKALLSTIDNTISPTLLDVTINYSP